MPLKYYPNYIPRQVTAYTDLPDGPPNGTKVAVTSSGLEEIYQYVSEVDGIAIGLWIPARWAVKISGLVQDSSSNHCYINITDGDDYTAVTTRGWSDTSTSTADVQDALSNGEDVLEFDSDSGGNARIEFTPTAIPSEFLTYQEIDCVERNGTTANSACRLQIRNGSKSILFSHSRGAANGVGFATAFSSSTGDGIISNSSFDPIFGHLHWESDKVFEARSPVSTDLSNAFYDSAGSSGATTINWGTGSQASNRFHLKKFYFFDLT